ncbi:MAG: DNA-3-methyladenine glycosylase family protein, partial [Candidatus Ranarchaeia archaeon]
GDKQIRNYENGRFWQVIRVNDKLILAIVKAVGTIDKPKVAAELKSNGKITEEDMKKAEETVTALFSLDYDLKPFYEMVKDDKIMAHLTRKLWGLKSPTTPTIYEALVDSIVEQQISLEAANSIENKITKKFGDTLDLEGDTYYAYPTPQRLASVSAEEFRECGLSFRKGEYIKGASTLIAEGKLNLEKLKNFESSEQIIRELDEIRGIGVWTAELTMLRGMQRLEALPADDLGLRRVISHYYCDGKMVTGVEARRIAIGWGRWKGLAAYYLVVASMLEIDV